MKIGVGIGIGIGIEIAIEGITAKREIGNGHGRFRFRPRLKRAYFNKIEFAPMVDCQLNHDQIKSSRFHRFLWIVMSILEA